MNTYKLVVQDRATLEVREYNLVGDEELRRIMQAALLDVLYGEILVLSLSLVRWETAVLN